MAKIKLPRIQKLDNTKYTTGDDQDWTYEYTYEDLLVALSIREWETEPSPTFKQIYLYGVISEIFKNVQNQLNNTLSTNEAKIRWEKMIAEVNDKK